MDDAARTKALFKFWVLWIVRIFRLLLRVQVVKISKELVKAMRGWQHVIAVTKMILSKLASHVSLRLQKCGDGWVFLFHAFGRARQTNLGQAGANRRLTSDKCGATGGATLLAVPIREQRAIFRNAVNVGRFVTHHAPVVSADIELTNVVAPDNENVWLFDGLVLRTRGCVYTNKGKHQRRNNLN